MRLYYYPAGKPKKIKKGDRFKLLTDSQYVDKLFLKGAKLTFLGWRKVKMPDSKLLWRWPKFQFDNDEHKQRVLDFDDDIKRI